MPSGDAEEIAVRVGVLRFFARLSACALVKRPTLILLLVRNPLRPMARIFDKARPNVGSVAQGDLHTRLSSRAHIRDISRPVERWP